MKRNKEDNENSLWVDGAILLVIIFFIALGAIGSKWAYWDLKIDEKDREIEKLNDMLAQYTVTDDMLLPCPWCKSEDVVLRDSGDYEWWYVHCTNCGAESPSHNYDDTFEHLTREEAFEIWNNFPREED